MKKIQLLIVLAFTAIIIQAQVPQGFNYQAILRNTDGTIMKNETISLQVDLVNESGVSAYLEIHNTRTNDLGLVNLVIGEGTSSDDMTLVDWASGPYFIDITVNGANLGSSPLLSVPYALYAASGNEGPQGPKGDPGPQGEQGEQGPQGVPGDTTWTSLTNGIAFNKGYVGIGTPTPTERLDVNGNLNVSGSIKTGGEELAKVSYVNALVEAINNELLAVGANGFIADYDGNVYKTVEIGNQVWMAENLKTSHYSDGTAIQYVDNSATWDALAIADLAYCWYDYDPASGSVYGALYNWSASMNGASSSTSNPSGVQGVCPAGWHMPSDDEWKELEIYLGMSPAEADNIDWRGTNEGGKLKEEGTVHFNSPNTGATNESGFTTLPGGFCEFNGQFFQSGNYAYFWTATENGTLNTWHRAMGFDHAEIKRNSPSKKDGFSVRCVQD